MKPYPVFISISWCYTNVYLLNERFFEWNKLPVIRYSVLTVLYYLWLSTLANKFRSCKRAEHATHGKLDSIIYICMTYKSLDFIAKAVISGIRQEKFVPMTILFFAGLDSMILAALLDKCLDLSCEWFQINLIYLLLCSVYMVQS